MSVENKDRELANFRRIMDILRNLINRGYHGDGPKNNLSTSINAHYFISTPVIQYSSKFYKLWRDILDSSEGNKNSP